MSLSHGPHPVLFGADFPWCWGWDRVSVCRLLLPPEHLVSRATASCIALVLVLLLRQQGLVLLWNSAHLSYVPETHSGRKELTPKSCCLGKVAHAFNPNTWGLQRQLDPLST